MRTDRKRLVMLIAAMTLVLSISAGVTFAFFSDYEAAKSVGVVGIGGKTQIVEQYDEKEKVVQIKNTGETDVIVRVAIYGPAGMDIEPADSKWKKFEGDDYYYYTEVLTPNGETSEIVAKTEGLLSKDLGDSFDVVVQHESAQVAYDENQKIIVPNGWKDAVNN